jgi:hypothetical protein
MGMRFGHEGNIEKNNRYVVLNEISSDQLENSVAKFIVPEWGILLTPAYVCRTGLPAYICSQAGRYDTFARDNFIPSVRDYKFGW